MRKRFTSAAVFTCLVTLVLCSPLCVQGQHFENQGAVAVPPASELAIRAYRSGNILWIATQAWTLVAPALLLLTAVSARVRNWAAKATVAWPLSTGIYLLSYLTITLVLNLPLSFYAGYLRPHAYGLSSFSVDQWFVGVLKTLLFTPQFPPAQIPGFLLGFPFVLVLYWLLKKSPGQWWLYTGLVLVPFFLVGSWIQPIWLDPILRHYGPVKNKDIETPILDLARRAGMEGGRVFEVEMSRETKSMGAVAVGQGGTRRIVLWDTLITGMERREVLTVVAHEIGHYVLGHGKYRLMVHALLLLLALGFVQWTSRPIMEVAKDKFGFDRLSDIASLPLIMLLINAALLLLMPIDLAFQRYQEREADRFAVELTRDNHAAATAYIKLSQGVLNMPKPGPLYTIWRLTHPSEASEVEFFNEYRPWQSGQALRYGSFIH